MSAAEWFFIQGSERAGPFTLEQIQSLFNATSINGSTLAWRPGYSNWMPLANFAEFNPPPAPPLPRQEEAVSPAEVEPTVIAQNGPSPLINAKQWVDERPHPWRRYFARTLDNLLWAMILMSIVGIGLAAYDEELLSGFETMFDGPGGRVVDIVLSLILCIIPNAILIGLTGGNLGKWLFGICILDQEDRPIGLLRSLQREFRVYVFGLGLGIPIVAIVTGIVAYQKLKGEGMTSWDRALNVKVVHRRSGPVQYIGATAGVVIVVGLLVLVAWLNTL